MQSSIKYLKQKFTLKEFMGEIWRITQFPDFELD